MISHPTKTKYHNWKPLIQTASRSDHHNLLDKLYREAFGTEFQSLMQTVTRDWLDGLKLRDQKSQALKKTTAVLIELQPQIEFLLSLTTEMKTLINVLFEKPTTLYFVWDKNTEELCAVLSDSSTAIISEYSKIYTDLLISEDVYFRFMVHGEGEIHEGQYNIKITKEEWYAFNR